MLTKEQNELLTMIGPGTPGGEMLRRYWQPVALAGELPIGGDPLQVRILGEDLVLFRDERNRPGLLGLQCPHRCTNLSYGRIEAGGLRCIYHGWLFDINGNCLEQPGEPAGSNYKDKVKHTAYPCIEKVGIIFAYTGPGEPPQLPNYEFLTLPDEYVHVSKVFHECNYLQANEGNIDPVHLSFLHAFKKPKEGVGYSVPGENLFTKDAAVRIELDHTDYGLRIHTLRNVGDQQVYLRVTNFIMPNLSAFTGALADGYTINWHVPIDDTHHWRYKITFTRNKLIDKQFLDKVHFEGGITEDYKPTLNRSNRYLQNRKIMKTWNYSGIGETPGGSFTAQDSMATESQGYIQDRTKEHLGTTDKAIAAARQMLLRAIRDVQEGKQPTHVIENQKDNKFNHLVVLSEVLPNSEDWRNYWKCVKRTDGIKEDLHNL